MARLLHFLLIYFCVSVAAAQQPTITSKPYVRERLINAIASYQEILETGTWNTFPAGTFIRPGDSSNYVTALQQNLKLTGDLAPDAATLPGVYTPAVQIAVAKFQKRHGLVDDGVVGPNTVATLNIPLSYRLWQLQSNLSHWDTTFFSVKQPYVVINLPDYTLQVVDSNKTVLSMRVIIGKPELRTNALKTNLNMLVMYPYWYIPKSIAVDEIVPLLRKNPGYLAKKRMKLEKKTAHGWVRINPWRINWNKIHASNFNYRIVQLSGKQNELGQVKFLYTNPIAQYMHDTPNKELFDYPKRAFSHGCIRLEKPFELADLILERGSGYSPDKIENLWNKHKQNYYLRIKDPLPLHIVYFTAWVDDALEVQFREDVYDVFTLPQLSAE